MIKEGLKESKKNKNFNYSMVFFMVEGVERIWGESPKKEIM